MCVLKKHFNLTQQHKGFRGILYFSDVSQCIDRWLPCNILITAELLYYEKRILNRIVFKLPLVGVDEYIDTQHVQ